MTRGKGIYDDERSEESKSEVADKDPDKDTPDVNKDADEPTA